MQTLRARDAKCGFGHLINLARSWQIAVAKHGRPVFVTMSVEKYDRLQDIEMGRQKSSDKAGRACE